MQRAWNPCSSHSCGSSFLLNLLQTSSHARCVALTWILKGGESEPDKKSREHEAVLDVSELASRGQAGKGER